MKRIIAATAVAAALAAGNTQAASTSGQFNVNITLTSVCTISTITDLAFAYTSFQGGVSNATGGGFTVTCTNALPYTLGLQAGTAAATPPGAATINVTDDFVILNYTLGISSPTGTIGNGAARNHSVTGTMAGGQVGTCNTPGVACTNATATNKRHTLIVEY